MEIVAKVQPRPAVKASHVTNGLLFFNRFYSPCKKISDEVGECVLE